MSTLISQDLNDAFNAQIGREFGASLQYMQIAAFFDGLALDRTSKLFFEQAQEEHDHAMKFIKYILDAGGEVHIPPLEAPKSNFTSAEEAVGLALKWEVEVTQYIHNLMEIVLRDKDYIARPFLDWFETEQLEEVSKMDKLMRVVKSVGERNLYTMEAYLSHMG